MRILSVHLTDLCNSACEFCVVGSPQYSKDTVDYDTVTAFLRDNAKRFQAVNFHGGEPTIHPMFLDTVRLARSLGYERVEIQTNGLKLADERFVAELAKLDVKLFVVSLHGATGAVQDAQTGTSKGWDKTVRGLRNLRAAGLPVRTNTVITNANLTELPDIARLACDLGVQHLNFSAVHPVGSALLSRLRIVPRFAALVAALAPAVAHAQSARRQVTLEGFPACVLPPEWQGLRLERLQRKVKMLIRGAVLDDYDEFMDGTCRRHGPACSDCSARNECGGVYPEYTGMRGWSEFTPLRPSS